MSAQQPKFLDVPPALLDTLSIGDANRFIEGWGHKLGPINRPFGMQAFALFTDGYPRAVAVSASIVSATVAGYKRREVVELARLCSNPESPSMSRVMLRLWREVCAEKWPYWPIRAAISYSLNALHGGSIYRFDGWEKVADDVATSGGGGAWSRRRTPEELVGGSKTLWVWRFAS